MARHKKSNHEYNNPIVLKYLNDNDIPYEAFNEGYHLKIMGAVNCIDLWPGHMTFHIITSEDPDLVGWHGGKKHSDSPFTLSDPVNIEELDNLLNSFRSEK